jgi:hypothetical protein
LKVTLDTIKEIVVFNLHKTTVQDLTKDEAISDTPVLLWSNGILFNVAVATNDQIFLKQTQGIEYLDTVTYAFSDKITESKWNGYTIEVRDMTNHSVYEPLTKSLLETQ